MIKYKLYELEGELINKEITEEDAISIIDSSYQLDNDAINTILRYKGQVETLVIVLESCAQTLAIRVGNFWFSDSENIDNIVSELHELNYLLLNKKGDKTND